MSQFTQQDVGSLKRGSTVCVMQGHPNPNTDVEDPPLNA